MPPYCCMSVRRDVKSFKAVAHCIEFYSTVAYVMLYIKVFLNQLAMLSKIECYQK